MKRSARAASLFSQTIDRVAVTTYFLGAIVPLVALGVVVDRFALPLMTDRTEMYALIGAVASITVLSMSSFLVLRHVTRRTLRNIDGDNRRLAALLSVSKSLASTEHVTEATQETASSALDLCDAPASFLFLREGSKISLAEMSGDRAEGLYQELQAPIDEIASMVTEHGRPVIRAIGDDDPTPYAMTAVPVPGERKVAGSLVVVRVGAKARFSGAEADALTTLGALTSVALHNADLRDSQRNFFSHVTDMLATALDAHLGFNTGHGARVAQYANRLGRSLGLDDERLQRLHFAALLHDIGMLKLDPNQKMNPRTCEKHCTLGFRMLNRIRLWKDVAPIVHTHHEWWNGRGYPEGLAGEAISLEARIVGLCDAFDSMTSGSSYRAVRTVEDAVEELSRCAGTQFDPGVVEAFRKLVEDGVISL
jgi:putative nucleotidyltransferase with HDIG domain